MTTFSLRAYLTGLRLGVIVAFLSSSIGWASSNPVRLNWEDLMPNNFDQQAFLQQLDIDQYKLDDPDLYDQELQRLNKDMYALFSRAPVVTEYTGKVVQIPGFVVPLDMEDDRIQSFLLVPYFGACIHTPPPPANQIIFVENQQSFKLLYMDEAMMVTGVLMDDHVSSEQGDAGYRLYATEVVPYTN